MRLLGIGPLLVAWLLGCSTHRVVSQPYESQKELDWVRVTLDDSTVVDLTSTNFRGDSLVGHTIGLRGATGDPVSISYDNIIRVETKQVHGLTIAGLAIGIPLGAYLLGYIIYSSGT